MSRSPKILVVSNYTDFHSVRPEAEIFLSLRRRGYEITVMTYAGSEYAERFAAAGINVIDHHPSKKFDSESVKRIREELISGNYDVLHLYNNRAITNGLKAAKGLPVTTIGYRGSTLNFEWYNPYNYLKHLSPALDFVICNSEGVAEQYRKHPFFNSTKAIVINKGHDLLWYADVEPLDLRSRYEIPDSTAIFILVATDRTMKGVKYLCDAVNLLPADLDFRLFMIGGGMDNDKYIQRLSSGANADKVIMLGHTSEALRFVAGADVFVLPSVKGESITKAVLEAMSLGRCPLITNIAGNVELVNSGKSGLVVPRRNAKELASAIHQLCDDSQMVAAYGAAAKKRIATNLNHKNSVAGYEKLYKSIMSTA